MTEAFAKQIETEARQAMTELVAAAKLKKGDVLVVGCSSSDHPLLWVTVHTPARAR